MEIDLNYLRQGKRLKEKEVYDVKTAGDKTVFFLQFL